MVEIESKLDHQSRKDQPEQVRDSEETVDENEPGGVRVSP